MALVRFDPFREISGVVNKMNEFLSDVDVPFRSERRGFFPNVDISEDDKSIFINVELPPKFRFNRKFDKWNFF